ncbi:MAG: leucine-rich repeat domain-containing protein, partial [Ureaplasma sp.]|nr:leucine-rich repeat domain-containing protein [Ureaplasma sp.]
RDVILENLYISDTDKINPKYVSTVQFDSYKEVLTINLTPDLYQKFSFANSSNISLKDNQIRVSNLEFMFKEYNELFYTWNGTEITGLSALGEKADTLVLPPKTTSISANFFQNINSYLKKLHMSLTEITSFPPVQNSKYRSFFGVFLKLGYIKFPTKIDKIGSYWFSQDYLYYFQVSHSYRTSIKFLGNIKYIEDWAFFTNYSLASMIIPNSVTSIGQYAFSYCISLTSITIPNSVTSIGQGTFEYCWDLISITMPNSVTSIGTGVFTIVPSTCVMNVKKGWDTKLATNAGYQGKFNFID